MFMVRAEWTIWDWLQKGWGNLKNLQNQSVWKMNQKFYQSQNFRFRRGESQPEYRQRSFRHSYKPAGEQHCYGQDTGNRSNWYDKGHRIQKDIFEEKTNCDKIEQKCLLARVGEDKFNALSGYLCSAHNIQQLQKKFSQLDNQSLLLLQNFNQREENLNQALNNANDDLWKLQGCHNKIAQIHELTQFLTLKKNQLYQLSEENIHETTSEDKKCLLENQIREKQVACRKLKAKKKEKKENIKQLKKNIFEINQDFCKQERINFDLRQQIVKMNEKIEKQAQIDEKLRLENLKKMEESEVNKLHPADLPYEDLRKLKQKNHGLKLIILKIKGAYDAEKEDDSLSIPPQIFKQIQAKIDKAASYVERNAKVKEQNLYFSEQIKIFKAKIDQHSAIDDTSQGEELESEIEKVESKQIDLKATVKILKRQAELAQSRLKKCLQNKKTDKKNDIEENISASEEESSKRNTSQGTRIPDSKNLQNFSDEDQLKSELESLCPSDLPQPSLNSQINSQQCEELSSRGSILQRGQKSSKKKGGSILKEGQKMIRTLRENDFNEDMVYIRRPIKKGQFVFTVTYLVLLVGLAYFYNKIRVYFLINN